MSDVIELPINDWELTCSTRLQALALESLEKGNVLLLPNLSFALDADEQRTLTAAVDTDAKNVSLDASRQTLRGSGADAQMQRILQGAMSRFAQATQSLLAGVLPRYTAGLQAGRTSFRPAEISGRKTSWRKDDTRLHVDSFPSSPTQGKRILRVFTNVNPNVTSRVWRLGEPFVDVVQRFVPSLPHPIPGSAPLLDFLGITKSRRSRYDHYMLHLHDRMKSDWTYQAEVKHTTHHFLPDNTWIVFTDQTSHAAMSGQFAFEQTYYLPVDSLQTLAQSPLGVLEKFFGRTLI